VGLIHSRPKAHNKADPISAPALTRALLACNADVDASVVAFCAGSTGTATSEVSIRRSCRPSSPCRASMKRARRNAPERRLGAPAPAAASLD